MNKDKNVKERTHGNVLEHTHDGYEHWHPAIRVHTKIGLCDLCNIEISVEQSKIVPPNELREAIRKGFRPNRTGSIAETMKKMGVKITDKELDDGWAAIAMRDPSAWALCDVCAEKFERYMTKK